MSRVLIGVAAAARATTCITLAATIRRPEGQPLPTGKTDWAALDAMTDEELEAAASADPDCPSLRDDQTLRHMARAKRTRFDLRLDRKAFAERYHIPLATLVA